jgi:hypothetical protein
MKAFRRPSFDRGMVSQFHLKECGIQNTRESLTLHRMKIFHFFLPIAIACTTSLPFVRITSK